MLIKYFSRTVSLVLKLLAWQPQETIEKKSEVFTFRANALCGHSRNLTIKGFGVTSRSPAINKDSSGCPPKNIYKSNFMAFSC